MKPFQPKGGAFSVSSLVSGLFTSPKIRITIGIFFLMLFSFKTYGQQEWTLLKEEGGVQVYYGIAQCDNQQVLDPLNTESASPEHDAFQLKLVNSNSSSKSISFSKITKIDGSDEMETIDLPSGTTILESCDDSPKMILTQQSGDGYPIAMTDFIEAFKITIND